MSRDYRAEFIRNTQFEALTGGQSRIDADEMAREEQQRKKAIVGAFNIIPMAEYNERRFHTKQVTVYSECKVW